MKNKIIMRHWTEGGTALTNFTSDQFPLYLEAVRRFGDSRFVVVNDPIPAMNKGEGGSLHIMSNMDCSSFWETFREVKEEISNSDKNKESERLAAEMLARVMKK